ncbi:MAG: hypothetical protein FIA99_01140 [Ruminiclostridium sp.]|nr:hypothetical protein [Ruminiclostridium sp.]
MVIKEISEDKIIWTNSESILLNILLLIAFGVYILIWGISPAPENIWGYFVFQIVRIFAILSGGSYLICALRGIIFNERESVTIDKKHQKVIFFKKSINNITYKESNTIKEIPFSDIANIHIGWSPSESSNEYFWYPVLITIQGESIDLPYTNDKSSTEKMIRNISKIMQLDEKKEARTTQKCSKMRSVSL